jgi:hypothetical protein
MLLVAPGGRASPSSLPLEPGRRFTSALLSVVLRPTECSANEDDPRKLAETFKNPTPKKN